MYNSKNNLSTIRIVRHVSFLIGDTGGSFFLYVKESIVQYTEFFNVKLKYIILYKKNNNQ